MKYEHMKLRYHYKY